MHVIAMVAVYKEIFAYAFTLLELQGLLPSFILLTSKQTTLLALDEYNIIHHPVRISMCALGLFPCYSTQH